MKNSESEEDWPEQPAKSRQLNLSNGVRFSIKHSGG
jgi:hypothetical protein